MTRSNLHHLVAVTAVLLAVVHGQESYSTLKQAGARNLLIVLNCKPGDRPAFRRAISTNTVLKLAELKKKGSVQSYRVLFNRFLDSETWDVLILADFANDAGPEIWSEIEAATPAGLDGEAARLITAGATYYADVVSHERIPTGDPSSKPVYMVIPYTIEPNSSDEYVKYAQAYVVPQLQGWMREGALAGWDLFVSRYAAARPWQAVLVLQYRDETALGQRDRVITKVRSELALNPEWKAVSDTKHKMRTELRAVIADQLAGSN